MENEKISEEVKKNILQAAVFYLTKDVPFMGGLLQELNIKYTYEIPTICLQYHIKKSEFQVLINPEYFLKCSPTERVALFHHEMLHFTSRHAFRVPILSTTDEEKRIYNIAGDMAINQFISGLPKGAVDFKNWKLDEGTPFPAVQSMEYYYSLINKEKNHQDKQQNKSSRGKGNVQEMLDGYEAMDEHPWDKLSEEEKKEMLEEAKKVLKRTIEKTSTTGTKCPDGIAELLQEMESECYKIDCKQILKNTIKRTVSCADRESTWKRPNKRYGAYSPGTKVGAFPKLGIYIDSSGSISVTEANLFLSIGADFLKVGVRSCDLALWHDDIYYKKKYRVGDEIEDEFEGGGTNIACVLEDIKKCKPDLSIILTDGYFDEEEINITTEVLWIISSGGTENHPMVHLGKTIKLDNLK